MFSTKNLSKPEYKDRKVVHENINHKNTWVLDTDPRVPKLTMPELVNMFHFSPPVYEKNYRHGSNIIKGAEYILIDVDTIPDNVQEQLDKHGLEYIKAPSGSASKSVTHKWHYFVKCSEPLSILAHIAKAQIADLYGVLGLEGYDSTSIDSARYFAPCGCHEVLNSKAWKKRIKWCNKNTVHVWKGRNQWVPKDPLECAKDVKKFIGTTSGVIDVSKLKLFEGVPTKEVHKKGKWTAELYTITNAVLKSMPNESRTVYRIDGSEHIFIPELGAYSTFASVAAQIGDDQTVSNFIACPVENPEHKSTPHTVGYGLITRRGNTVYFTCQGDACANTRYYIITKEAK